MGVAEPVAPALLQQTPSRSAGVSRAKERQLRAYGAELLQRATVLLRLPQLMAVSGAAIFQRFYFRRSFVDVDVRMGAAAALLLATKLEEDHRRLNDIVTTFHRLHLRALQAENQEVHSSSPAKPLFASRPVPASDLNSQELSEWRQAIVSTEQVILQELGFAVAFLLDHPHKYVLQFIKSLQLDQCKRRTGNANSRLFAQVAWNYLNDSTRTTLCCEYQPHQLASAAVFLAARKQGLRLPSKPPWWEVFDSDLADIRRIASTILALYRRPAPQYVNLVMPLLRSGSSNLPPSTPLPSPLPSPLPAASPPTPDTDGCSKSIFEAKATDKVASCDGLPMPIRETTWTVMHGQA